jgi:hypothetical protein
MSALMSASLRRAALNPRRGLTILIGVLALGATSAAGANVERRGHAGDRGNPAASRARPSGGSATNRAHGGGSASRRHSRSRRAGATGHALKMIWGPLTMPNGTSAFPVYHRLGVQVLELQLIWAEVAPTRPGEPANPADPAYHWPAQLEQAAAEATRYNIQLAIMVKGSPSWANGGQSSSWAPENPAEYGAFLQAASRRFPSVHYWMIWGEVTRHGNFNPMPPNSPEGPRRYALLLEAAYEALKAVSPANMVIGGMTYTVGEVSASDFLRWLRLPDGAPPRMDFYGHNPYSTRFPKLSDPPYSPAVRDIDDVDTLDQELVGAYAGHGPAPKLWLSEFGISSDTANRAFDYFVSRAVQARWVTAAFKLADSVPYVAGLGWYDLLDEPSSVPEHITEGLMTAEGKPKPAFYAYAKAP